MVAKQTQGSGSLKTATSDLSSSKWTTYRDLSNSRDGGDPLGFRAAANRVARRLSPGLSRSSPLTRGFGLLAMGLSLSSDEISADELMQRFERFWVLAHVQSLPEGTSASFAGKLVATRLLKSDYLDLTVDLIQDQLSRGLWGAYRRPARLFGLIEMDSAGRRDARPSTTHLTASGKELAKATRAAILGGELKRIGALLEYDQIHREDLEAVVGPGPAPSQAEVEILSAGMAKFDERHRHPYKGLRACFTQSAEREELTIDSLDASLLNDDQRNAHQLGLAIAHLINEVELPYREWMLGNQVSLPLAITQDRAWREVEQSGERDLVDLYQRLLASGSQDLLVTADEHQGLLAEARGSTPWERDLTNPSWSDPGSPDFGLSSPRSLFREDVLDASLHTFDAAAQSNSSGLTVEQHDHYYDVDEDEDQEL
jgi:hypothetical protein